MEGGHSDNVYRSEHVTTSVNILLQTADELGPEGYSSKGEWERLLEVVSGNGGWVSLPVYSGLLQADLSTLVARDIHLIYGSSLHQLLLSTVCASDLELGGNFVSDLYYHA